MCHLGHEVRRVRFHQRESTHRPHLKRRPRAAQRRGGGRLQGPLL